MSREFQFFCPSPIRVTAASNSDTFVWQKESPLLVSRFSKQQRLPLLQSTYSMPVSCVPTLPYTVPLQWPLGEKYQEFYAPEVKSENSIIGANTQVKLRAKFGETKTHSCPTCLKTFFAISALKRHHRTHTGEKPFKCPIKGCEKRFADASNAQRHELVHTGKKPFRCLKCTPSRGFTRSGTLKKHMMTVHKDSDQMANSPPSSPSSPTLSLGSLQEQQRMEWIQLEEEQRRRIVYAYL